MPIRAFISLEIPDPVKNHLENIVKDFSDKFPDIRFIDKKNWHLTLRFLGYIEEEELRRSERLLGKIAGSFTPFNLTFDGFMAFPSLENPRVLGIRIKNSQVLQKLSQRIISGFNREKIGKTEKRAYVPHLTLARLYDQNIDLSFLKDKTFSIDYQANDIYLMESILGPLGAQYKILSQIPLCQK